jgi:hypothetical protein
MQRLVLLFSALALSITVTSAQTDLGGFYLHKTFIDSMKAKRSLVRALHTVRSPQPLAMALSASDSGAYSAMVFSSAFDSTATMVAKRAIKNVGDHYALGRFIITYDSLSMQYLALVNMDSIEAPPTLYARIPSKRTDAGFVLQRAANSAMLTGTWKDAKGRTYTFGKDMIAKWPGGTFPYMLNTGLYSLKEDILFDATPGTMKRYILEFKNGALQVYKATTKGRTITRGKKELTLRRVE